MRCGFATPPERVAMTLAVIGILLEALSFGGLVLNKALEIPAPLLLRWLTPCFFLGFKVEKQWQADK